MILKSVFDQLGDNVTFKFPPERILSLVPSQTELLADLGLQTEIIGITKFCVHPTPWLKDKAIIGGTKNFRFDLIDNLAPDLIIGNKEENYKEGIVTLKKKYPVWMSDVISYHDAQAMIHSIGDITNRKDSARQINADIDRAFYSLVKREPASVLYLIWRKPWMAAARHTFITMLLEKMGLENCLTDQERYPELKDEDIRALAPKFIFLSSEPFPFREEHVAELQSISPASRIVLVDGEMFSWYGSRLALAPAYFNSLALF